MKYYAIRKKSRKNKYIAGTDYTHSISKPRQVLSNEVRPPLLFTEQTIKAELRHRHVNLENYEVITVEVKESQQGVKVERKTPSLPEVRLCTTCESVMVHPYDSPCKTCLRHAEHPSYKERVKA